MVKTRNLKHRKLKILSGRIKDTIPDHQNSLYKTLKIIKITKFIKCKIDCTSTTFDPPMTRRNEVSLGIPNSFIKQPTKKNPYI